MINSLGWTIVSKSPALEQVSCYLICFGSAIFWVRLSSHFHIKFSYSDGRSNVEILPFQDTFEIKLLSGRDLVRLLEVSVSEDSPEGKFLQVSGISFDVNKKLPVGSRLSNVNFLSLLQLRQKGPMGQDSDETPCADLQTSIKPDALYTTAVSSFLARGYDGYDDLKRVPTLHCHSQSEQITHAELVMRLFGFSLGRRRPSQEASDHQSSNPCKTDELGIGSDDEFEALQYELSSDTEACQSLCLRNLVWEKRALKRAREYLITGFCETTGLPIIGPTVDGRITPLQNYD